MKYNVLDITPGPSLDNTLARFAARDGSEPVSVLFRAVADRRLGLTIIFNHRASWTPRSIKSNLPRIVLVSDDFGESRDPSEWRCGISAIAWSRSAIVHGTGGQVEHYQTALLAAELTRRCLFIETDSDHVPAWAAAIQPRGIQRLTIIPPNGGVHPAPEAAAA